MYISVSIGKNAFDKGKEGEDYNNNIQKKTKIYSIPSININNNDNKIIKNYNINNNVLTTAYKKIEGDLQEEET